MARQPGDFTRPKLSRGRITNMRTGYSRAFSINPAPIRLRGGAVISEDPIPNFSDSLLRFAAGKTKVISFQLQIDGEMTYRNLGIQAYNGVHPERDIQGTYSVAGELEWYDSLTYPVDPSLPGSDGGLDRVLLSYGTYLNAVECFVEEANATILALTPDLSPTRATVDVTLKRVVDENVYADRIWRS